MEVNVVKGRPGKPLLERNLNTCNTLYLYTYVTINVQWRGLNNVLRAKEDGLILLCDTGQNGEAALQMDVLEDGSCMLRQNGEPICVLTH
jgi:hypothetical protein